jgi:hypothetical protein
LQKALWETAEGLSGKEFGAVLADSAKSHSVFEDIRRIRIREALGVMPGKDTNGRPL